MNYLPLLCFLLCLPLFCSAQTTHTVRSGEATIHVKTFGKGQPVLIINGGPGFNSSGFEPLALKIEALGYQAILFDQRGTGLSKLPTVDASTITMDLMVQDIEAIRKHLKLQEWTVLGHSFGGMLANYYASKHPQSITAMIQSSSGGIDLSLLQNAQNSILSKFTPAEIDSLNRWRRAFQQSDNLPARRKHNQLLAKAYVYKEGLIPVIADRLMEGDLALNRMVWNNMLAIEYDCKTTLASFCKPVLIIQGQQDVVSKELAQTAHQAYCRSNMIFLDQCGHYGWLDQEKAYLEALQHFLEGVYSSTTRQATAAQDHQERQPSK